MDLLSLREWWTHFAAGPEVLFTLRLSSAVALAVFSALAWWGAVRPPERATKPGWLAVIWTVLRLLMAVFATGMLAYFILSGYLERDRVGTPTRLIWANICTTGFFWILSLHAIRRRVDSWAVLARKGLL